MYLGEEGRMKVKINYNVPASIDLGKYIDVTGDVCR